MPDRVLSKEERDNISASNLVAADGKHINRDNWSSADVAFIRTAAEQPDVERVLVNAAIKKELCRLRAMTTNLGCPKRAVGMATPTISMCVESVRQICQIVALNQPCHRAMVAINH